MRPLPPAAVLIALAVAITSARGPSTTAAAANPPHPLAALSYEGGGETSDAVTIDRYGRAAATARDRRVTAQFDRAALESLCPHLYDGTLRTLAQSRLDSEVGSLAGVVGLAEMPGGDRCRLTLPSQRGTFVIALDSPAILARRMAGRSEQVAAFEAVRQDLERLRNVVLLGGTAEATRLAEAAADAGFRVTLADLRFADLFGQDRTAHFRTADRLVMVRCCGDRIETDAFELASP